MLKLTMTGMRELQASLSATGAARAAMGDGIQAVAEDLAREARAIANQKRDTGALAGSIHVSGSGLTAAAEATAQHAAAVHGGRRAGARQPPTEAIAGWLARHGGDPAMAFVVARAIARRGIAAFPFFDLAFDKTAGSRSRQLAQVGRAIVRRLGLS